MAEQAGNSEGIKLFGFEIKRAKKKEAEKLPSVVPPRDDEGGSYATAAGSHYGQYLNLDGDDSKDNYQLIMKYRGNAMHPEVDAAIEGLRASIRKLTRLYEIGDRNLPYKKRKH